MIDEPTACSNSGSFQDYHNGPYYSYLYGQTSDCSEFKSQLLQIIKWDQNQYQSSNSHAPASGPLVDSDNEYPALSLYDSVVRSRAHLYECFDSPEIARFGGQDVDRRITTISHQKPSGSFERFKHSPLTAVSEFRVPTSQCELIFGSSNASHRRRTNDSDVRVSPSIKRDNGSIDRQYQDKFEENDKQLRRSRDDSSRRTDYDKRRKDSPEYKLTRRSPLKSDERDRDYNRSRHTPTTRDRSRPYDRVSGRAKSSEVVHKIEQNSKNLELSRLSSTGADLVAAQPMCISVATLLDEPFRRIRPPRIVILMRGLPGSGKTTVARLIKVSGCFGMYCF
ncbi:unnamed protein product [Protopolystoma xenopodis]|uniref:Uncharacterized protein n=1 Tax=Protopolystoma xenopodis TaxID=117903 RepID=A0A448X1F8_9PLAT|nr:unnamed protein product [Protopolystoma xenopodis]